jgi:hypothetical protein
LATFIFFLLKLAPAILGVPEAGDSEGKREGKGKCHAKKCRTLSGVRALYPVSFGNIYFFPNKASAIANARILEVPEAGDFEGKRGGMEGKRKMYDMKYPVGDITFLLLMKPRHGNDLYCSNY